MGSAAKLIPDAASAVYHYFSGDAPKIQDSSGLSGMSGNYVPDAASGGQVSSAEGGKAGNQSSFGMGGGTYSPDLGDTSTPGGASTGNPQATDDGGGFNYGDAVKGGLGILGGLVDYRNKEDERKKAKQLDADKQDTANRFEATYRERTEMLQNAVKDYYAKHGIPYPKTAAPGANTARQLPSENPLYKGQPDPRYPKPLAVNEQPPQPLESTSPQATSYVGGPLPISPTDGTLDAPPSETPNTNGKPNPIGPSSNALFDAAARVGPMFDTSDPDTAKKALAWRRING